MMNETFVLPLPLAPPGNEAQGAGLVMVHEHPAPVMMLKLPDPPEAGNSDTNGPTVYVQRIPSCVTVTRLPPAVSVAVCGVVFRFGAPVKLSVPFPKPVAPRVTQLESE